LNLKLDNILHTQAQHSSSETLLKRSAPDGNENGIWINAEQIFPQLISDLLNEGHHVRFSAPGDSMYPTICDGDIITVAPVNTARVTIGDIILYRQKSGVTAHRVMRIIESGEDNLSSAFKASHGGVSVESLQFILRGDAAVVCDDPVGADRVLGKVLQVERDGRRMNPYSLRAIIRFNARRIAARFKKSLRLRT
jgi:hypothetical protein